MEKGEDKLLRWLDGQYDAMVQLLEELVNTDSGSSDQEGVARVGDILRRHLEARGIACEFIECPGAAACLKATVPAESKDSAPVLLLGHRDTVFPRGTAAERPFRIEGSKAMGPGVADMKAGLVMNSFLLEAFARCGGSKRPLVGLYTVDEEIGSPASRPVIEETARGARAVFNSEPGRPSGNFVSERKGALFLAIEARGKPSHSGAAHEQGASAIEALCRKVVELHALTDYASGTTFNVGLIEGGQSVNTVAPSAQAGLDVRFETLAAMEMAEAAVQRILERTHVPGASARIANRAAFLPLARSPEGGALGRHYAACAGALGMEVEGERTGGSADSGFTAAVGAPTVCGVGPLGERAHSPEEFCRLDTLLPRAKALALAIARLDAGTQAGH